MPISSPNDSASPERSPGDAREPYEAPRLHRHGTFAAITQTVGTVSPLKDKSGGGTNKTH